ncbi:MAG: hypothetical protein F6K42_24095 [Leptolyngbya sp. SIO1D8]|nr:hypothetical protein [Leptolyngbya sp. SIO1D8]
MEEAETVLHLYEALCHAPLLIADTSSSGCLLFSSSPSNFAAAGTNRMSASSNRIILPRTSHCAWKTLTTRAQGVRGDFPQRSQAEAEAASSSSGNELDADEPSSNQAKAVQELPPTETGELFETTREEFETQTQDSLSSSQSPFHSRESSAPPPNSRATESTETSELNRIYEELIQGEYFHTIPKDMQVQQQLVIEAGVAGQVTEQLLLSLGINATATEIERGYYSPLGVEIRLIGDKKAFEIEDISTGEKAVITKHPESWQWKVSPIKLGKHILRLEAKVFLNSNNLQDKQEKNFLSESQVQVHGNLNHQIKSFITSYWSTISTFFAVIIFGFIGWYKSRFRGYHLSQKRIIAGKASASRERRENFLQIFSPLSTTFL